MHSESSCVISMYRGPSEASITESVAYNFEESHTGQPDSVTYWCMTEGRDNAISITLCQFC